MTHYPALQSLDFTDKGNQRVTLILQKIIPLFPIAFQFLRKNYCLGKVFGKDLLTTRRILEARGAVAKLREILRYEKKTGILMFIAATIRYLHSR